MKKVTVLIVATLMAATMRAQKQHESIDLGLSSRTKWATMNIGANTPEELGSYFAWGETRPKKDYSWKTYKFRTENKEDFMHENYMTKYCNNELDGKVDNKLELDDADDAATENWGTGWCMPTEDQWFELKMECKWEKISQKMFRVTGPNGRSILLPCGGYYSDTSRGNHIGEADAFYWSRTLNTLFTTEACCSNNGMTNMGMSRKLGFQVRAVRGSAVKRGIKDETEEVKKLLPDGKKSPGAQKVEEAKKLIYTDNPNYTKGINLLKEAADLGDTNAMWMLAKIYMEGKITGKDLSKAWEYAIESNGKGNPIGTYWMSRLYDRSHGATGDEWVENVMKGRQFCRNALEKLVDVAGGKKSDDLNRDYTELEMVDVWETMGRIADAYSSTQAMQDRAREYYSKAAEAGSSYAQRRMGDWCLTGSFSSLNDVYDKTVDSKNIPEIPSYANAMNYYQQAANRGDAEAQNILGVLIFQKVALLKEKADVPTSDNYYLKEAYKNFSNSVKGGNTDAYYNLAYCLERGYGCAKNLNSAKDYYRKAEGAGSKKATERLLNLQK